MVGTLKVKTQTGPDVWTIIGGPGPQGPPGTVPYWTGTQAQYDALGTYDSNIIYFITA